MPDTYIAPGTFDPTAYEFAISYGRFSHPIQATGQSRARQDNALQETLQRWGWKLLHTYFDPATSGAHGKARALGALSELVSRQNKRLIPAKTVLIVETFDRLSRENTTVAQEQFLRLVNRGLAVWTTMDGSGYDQRSMNNN